MAISIFTTDTELIIRSWDTRLAQMTGIKPDAACGSSLMAIIPDLESRGLLKKFQKVIVDGVVEALVPAFHHYLIPCPPQKPSKYFDRMQQKVTIAPLKEKETVVGTVVTLEDVTSRLEMERETTEELNPQTLSPPIDLPEEEELEILGDTDWRKRQLAVENLKERGDTQVNAELIRLLHQEHRNPSILNSVLQILTSSQIDPVPALIECLSEPDKDLRIYAALSLGERNDPRAIPALIKALDDPDQNVCYHAVEALGNLKAKEAIPRLTELAEGGDFFLAFPAFDALVKMGNTGVSSQLVTLLQNTLNWRVRRETVDSLALQNNSELMAELLRLLRQEHRNPNILNSILQILALSNIDPIPALRECLREPDPDLRIYAVLALGERNDPQTIPILIECLDDPNTNVRYHAIEPLGRLGATEAVEKLLTLVESDDFFLAFPAVEALRQIQDRSVVPRLLPLLNHDFLNTVIIQLLGELGDSTVVKPLAKLFNQSSIPILEVSVALAKIYQRYQEFDEASHILDLIRPQINKEGQENLLKALYSSPNSQELAALVLILGTLEDREAEIALTKLLGNSEVRERVLEILVSHGQRVTDLLIEQLESSDQETRKATVTALGRIGSTLAVQPLISLLSGAPELVMATTSALAQIGDHSAYEALLELLGNPDASVRLGAIAALNSLGHRELSQKILQLLEDDNPYVRESAVKIAGYFAFPEAFDLLIKCSCDPQERVRRAAIEVLPCVEDPRVLETLLNALTEDSQKVRAAAAAALGELQDVTAFPYLVKVIQDQAPWVRYHAIRSLSKLKPLSNQDFSELELFNLLRNLALNDPANPVRAAAADALGTVGQEQAIPILEYLLEQTDCDEDIARASLMALGRIPSASVIPCLLTVLNSSNPERRLDAIQAFRERGGSEAVVTLQWMAASDAEERVVKAAIDSLGKIATPEAIASLLELTVDPTNRDCCITTLTHYSEEKHLDKEEYIKAIAQGLNHVHTNIRLAVVEVLKRLKHPVASQYLILALKDQETSVRLAAVNALIDLGNRNCQEELIVLVRNDPSPAIRRAAQKGLLSYQ